ncbi:MULTISPECIES: triose-phosphate isomerase [Vagococcus]|uniref:Triosephosphate isomerase n=1 Tax=Vagococcus fluvialis bH819 TaxID=1255619 RepID=A0A1X6WJR9_9ENTE|nr:MULTISPECIES: triose-phosphate isomerase [Vagococcus]SLM84534.1 Triosephosphate isomerase [Vagococcus fluvialis bH819]HCM90001.1 triose-phosphate isomerase [Vagococcus sp.]
MKRELRTPFFVVNPKAYLYGEKSLELALQADALSEKYDVDILFTVQHADAYRISQQTKHLIITVQHMDSLVPGRGMGYILPEGLVENGVAATFLNHAEHPVQVSELVQVMKRADELDLLTIVCADSIAEAKAIASLNPDIMICEPTELIGTGQSSDIEYMRNTNESVNSVNPDILVLQAAGISSPEDVRKALMSGADATGGTSGIIAADNPVEMLEEMLKELVRFREEQTE